MNRFFVRWLRPPKCGEAADDRRLHQDKLFQNTALHTCRSVLHLLFVSRFFLLFFSTAICFPSFFFRHRRSKRHTRHTANEIFPLAHVLASAIDNKRRESYDGGGGGMSRDEGLKERTNDGTWFCFRFFENKTTQGRLGRDMRRSTIAAKSNWGKHLFCFNNWCSCRGETKEQIYFDVILKRKRQRGEGEKKVPALEATTTKLLSFCFLVTRELYHYMLASQNSQSPLFFAKVILTKTQPPT